MSRSYACIISQNAETDADALLAIACGFAYRVEMLADGVLFDVSGLEKLVGDDKKIARKIVKELENNDISGNVAVAASVETALLLARENRGLNHTVASPDRFRQLPLRNLAIDRDTIGVFEALGISRIEDLDQIPANELTARYGHDFRDVIDVIAQKDKRDVVPNVAETSVQWKYDLDFPVDDFEQLIFIVNRGLEEMLAAVGKDGHSTEQIDIQFKVDKKGEKDYQIKTSFPTLDKVFWLKLINLRISVDPPEAGITAVRVVAHFTRPRPAQSGLYAVSRPQPESLLLTVGKIKKLVGDENVGVPVLLEKRVERPFALDAEALPAGREHIAAEPREPVIAFQYYEPPVAAEVLVRNRQLVYLRTPYFAGRVAACSGVWRLNSRWWERAWDTQEWHVEIENGGVYRLRKTGNEWLVIGEFD
jgi:protein ImuB